MTSEGTNTYKWDAENRLIEIDYPGANNFTSFSFDGNSRNTKIVETTSGSVTSTRQWVWCEDAKRKYTPCEQRDGSGTTNKQFFGRGQKNSSTIFVYTRDHLGSIREMTDNAGAVQSQYQYQSFGSALRLVSSQDSDFQYAGYLVHTRSGLNQTRTRPFNSSLGRWLQRDFVEELDDVNLYRYVHNNPVSFADPSGLGHTPMICPPDCEPGDKRRICYCRDWCDKYAVLNRSACIVVCMLDPDEDDPMPPGQNEQMDKHKDPDFKIEWDNYVRIKTGDSGF